jgi:HupE / UreJ protein
MASACYVPYRYGDRRVPGACPVPFPSVEIGIALSARLFGAAVMTQWRPPLLAAAALVAVFALFHGHIHGAGLPPAESALPHSIVVATGCLHLGGGAVWLGTPLAEGCGRRRRSWRRIRPCAGIPMTKLSRGSGWVSVLVGWTSLGFGVESAQAHLVTIGLSPINDGVAHFASTPAEFLSLGLRSLQRSAAPHLAVGRHSCYRSFGRAYSVG